MNYQRRQKPFLRKSAALFLALAVLAMTGCQGFSSRNGAGETLSEGQVQGNDLPEQSPVPANETAADGSLVFGEGFGAESAASQPSFTISSGIAGLLKKEEDRPGQEADYTPQEGEAALQGDGTALQEGGAAAGEAVDGQAAPEPYPETEPYDPPAAEPAFPEDPEPVPEQSFAAQLACSAQTTSLIVVVAYGTDATVSLHERNADGLWEDIFETPGYVGENGVGPTTEYNHRTPPGVYTLGICFGISPDPGCTRNYIQVDDSYYWVDDPWSPYYNQMISTNWDWVDPSAFSSGEHLIDYTISYQYSISIDYNTDCVPEVGSAIFFHVEHASPTWGCVGVPEWAMITVLQRLRPDTLIVIGNSSGADCLWNY